MFNADNIKLDSDTLSASDSASSMDKDSSTSSLAERAEDIPEHGFNLNHSSVTVADLYKDTLDGVPNPGRVRGLGLHKATLVLDAREPHFVRLEQLTTARGIGIGTVANLEEAGWSIAPVRLQLSRFVVFEFWIGCFQV